MPSSKKSDPAPVGETALSFGLAARRSAPVKTDAEIEYMVAVTGVIVRKATPMPLTRSAKREAFHYPCNCTRRRPVPAVQLFGILSLPIIGHAEDSIRRAALNRNLVRTRRRACFMLKNCRRRIFSEIGTRTSSRDHRRQAPAESGEG